jgi:ketosteroid isomerase-like protein
VSGGAAPAPGAEAAGLLAPDARIDCPAPVLDLILRQARAWIAGDLALAAPDWSPRGVLTAPGAVVPFDRLGRAIEEFHEGYRDLRITVTSAFAAPGGTLACLEWLWATTRRSDGARSVTADAIVVEIEEGRILAWREYFDTAGSVEAHHDEPRA